MLKWALEVHIFSFGEKYVTFCFGFKKYYVFLPYVLTFENMNVRVAVMPCRRRREVIF